ncbi:MAG: FAD-binding protein [Actinomycetota bacterium]|nr:FAD-binding protein [Actinomycetota bacterium]
MTVSTEVGTRLAAFAEAVGPTGPVAVVGGRTRWDLGGAPTEGTRLVTAPVGVVDYQPQEMTIRVGAGTTVADLNQVLADAGQRCALPDRGGTVGGALAVGQNDIDLLGRGRVRDAALQIDYISAEGRVVTAGGPTVKNVSGFNLPKALVGSLGTLGLFGEVILRTNPAPATVRWLHAERAEPLPVFEALLRPAAVLFDGQAVWVKLEGHTVDVDAESRALEALASFREVEGPPPLPPHRWSVTPADALRAATLPGQGERFVAAIGVGLLFADCPQPARPADLAARQVADRMKQLFDPSCRLNPGRRP